MGRNYKKPRSADRMSRYRQNFASLSNDVTARVSAGTKGQQSHPAPVVNYLHSIFEIQTLYNTWEGQMSCSNETPITAYTYLSEIILAIGVRLFKNNNVDTPYPNPYFVHKGVRYTVEDGIITLVEICDVYML